MSEDIAGSSWSGSVLVGARRRDRLALFSHLERVSGEALGELCEGVAIELAFVLADEDEIQHIVHLVPLGNTSALQELHRSVAVYLEQVGEDALAEVPVALSVLASEAVLLEPQRQGLALVHLTRRSEACALLTRNDLLRSVEHRIGHATVTLVTVICECEVSLLHPADMGLALSSLHVVHVDDGLITLVARLKGDALVGDLVGHLLTVVEVQPAHARRTCQLERCLDNGSQHLLLRLAALVVDVGRSILLFVPHCWFSFPFGWFALIFKERTTLCRRLELLHYCYYKYSTIYLSCQAQNKNQHFCCFYCLNLMYFMIKIFSVPQTKPPIRFCLQN